MKKSEMLELCKLKAKEIFKEFKKSGGLDIIDEEIEVIGLKEYEGKFRCLILYTRLRDTFIEFIFAKKNKRLTYHMYKKEIE